jgi:hypothetical protein
MIDLGKVINELKAAMTADDLDTDKEENLISKQSKGSKDFKKIHKIDKVEDRNGNKDDVFQATNVKTAQRPPHHGYNPEDDQDAYFPSQEDSIDGTKVRANIDKNALSGSVKEAAPPGKEKMVKAIKKKYAEDGYLSGQEKAIAYATAWKAYNKGK